MSSSSSVDVVIRPYQYGDEGQIKRILKNSTMKTAWPCFLSFAKREVVSQSILLVAAFLFVVAGLPLVSSLVSIPLVLATLALATWIGHYLKVILTHKDLNDIDQHYQTNPRCQFWVAEIFDQDALVNATRATFIRKGTTKSRHERTGDIIGTIAVTIKHDPDLREPPESVAWLRRMAVVSKFHRKG